MHRSSSRYEHTREGDLTGAIIRRVVEVFYGKARQDALLGPVFNELVHDWDAHIEKVSAFWRYATRLDRTYNSRDFMPAHMRHAQIQPSLLPQWLSLFRQAATDVCTEQGAGVLIDIAERMADSIEMSLARRSQLSSAADAGNRRGHRSAPRAKRAIALASKSQDFVPPRDEAERAYLESLVREDYARCHPGETLDDMKRRASFSKEDRGLYRDWLTIAAQRAAAGSVSTRPKPPPNEPAADETGARHLPAVGEEHAKGSARWV